MDSKESFQLETERLILRKLKESDAEVAYNNWTSDEEVSKFVRWSTHKNLEETKEYLREKEKNGTNKDDYDWGIVLKENGELIGEISAFKAENKRYELGYNIAKKCWRKGYTTEALKCVMKYLINEVGIKNFKASHAISNPASGAVMQKAGFKYVKDDYYEKFDKSIKFKAKVYYLDID